MPLDNSLLLVGGICFVLYVIYRIEQNYVRMEQIYCGTCRRRWVVGFDGRGVIEADRQHYAHVLQHVQACAQKRGNKR